MANHRHIPVSLPSFRSLPFVASTEFDEATKLLLLIALVVGVAGIISVDPLLTNEEKLSIDLKDLLDIM